MSLLATMRLPQDKADEILESVQVMEMAALEAMKYRPISRRSWTITASARLFASTVKLPA